MTGGRVLALDVGSRWIGVALSDPLRLVARPLAVIQHQSWEVDLAAIQRLVAENEAALVVCGHPLSLDGTEGPQGRRVRRYAEALRAALSVPVELWDESYSTVEAAEAMSVGRRPRSHREQRGWIDAVAAAVILQRYLDARAAGCQEMGQVGIEPGG